MKNRLRQHRQAELLYVESFDDKHKAALRERQIKKWRRNKKLTLIKYANKQVSLP